MGLFLLRCSNDDNGGGTPAPVASPGQPGAPTRSGSATVYTSSVTQEHTHTATIEDDSYSTPPAGGLSSTTSVNQGHDHPLFVSAEDLLRVNIGETISIVTGVSTGHTHTFTLLKIS
jgi:hypothetical protein